MVGITQVLVVLRHLQCSANILIKVEGASLGPFVPQLLPQAAVIKPTHISNLLLAEEAPLADDTSPIEEEAPTFRVGDSSLGAD